MAGVVQAGSPGSEPELLPSSDAGPGPQHQSRVEAKGGARRRAARWRAIRTAGWAAFALWFVVLVIFSASLYRRFFLAEDFGIYNQAWTLIGTGHLDPYNTVYGYPFIKGNLELILWPLALLHLIVPQSFTLLVVQDACMAGTGLVACLWITDVLERAATPIWVASIVAVAAVLVIVVNPGMYQTAGFDFHLEPIATLFLLLAGRDLWNGRARRAWVFAAIVLLCGSFATIGLFGLGVSAVLAGHWSRRHGLLLMVTSIAWLALINVLHADHAAGNLYGYLAGRSSLVGAAGVAALVAGVVTHPLRVVHQLQSRLGDIWTLLRPAGVIGLASSWGFGVPTAVILADALNSQQVYIQLGFQNFAVLPFVLVGTVMVLTWVAARLGRRHLVVGAVGLVGLLVTAQAIPFGISRSPGGVRTFLAERAGPAQAAHLQSALDKTPKSAEVVSSLSVMGRFCGRPRCYYFDWFRAQPVDSRYIVFVFAPNYEGAPTDLVHTAIDRIRYDLHAQVLTDADGVTVLEWRPPAGTKQFTVP